jgi:hypothetical protein
VVGANGSGAGRGFCVSGVEVKFHLFKNCHECTNEAEVPAITMLASVKDIFMNISFAKFWLAKVGDYEIINW